MAAALGFRWDGKKARLLARTKADSFNTESLILFLKDLKRFVQGAQVILVWDRLPAHRSKVMKCFLLEQREWLEIEWLPGAKENAPLLMPAVAKHTAGSEPQSSNPTGAEVRPIEAPKSKTSNRSPA